MGTKQLEPSTTLGENTIQSEDGNFRSRTSANPAAEIEATVRDFQRRIADLDPTNIIGYMVAIASKGENGEEDMIGVGCEAAGIKPVRNEMVRSLNRLMMKTYLAESDNDEDV